MSDLALKQKYDYDDLKKACYIYIIECSDNSYYVGMSNDLLGRFAQHKFGKGAQYTKENGVGNLVYFERYLNRSVARKRELEIQKKGNKYIELLIKEFNKLRLLL